jgi:hypothetical protein
MNRFIRLVAFAVAVFALAGAPAFGFAQDKGDGSQSQPCSEEGKVSDP